MSTFPTHASGFRLLQIRLLSWWHRVKALFPRLVWQGDEIDVVITFKNDPIHYGSLGDSVRGLGYGAIAEAKDKLERAGITFDQSMSEEGRHWEMDFSLRGPVSIKFRSKSNR